MDQNKSPAQEALKTMLRNALFAAISAIITFLIEGGLKTFTDGLSLDPDTKLALVGFLTWLLTGIDKNIHEKAKLQGDKNKGLVSLVLKNVNV